MSEAEGRFAPWVDWHIEHCRNGRALITAVNQRDGRAIYLDADDLDPSSFHYASTFAELEAGGFLANEAADHGNVVGGQATAAGLVWRGADRFVRRSHDAGLHKAFEPCWLAAQLVLASVGTLAIVMVLRTGGLDLHARPEQIPAIIGLGLVAVFIHEMGHALVTVHFGRRVRMAGLRLHLGSPAFYVESLDALLLTRRQRLLQAAAGPWAEWLTTSVAALVFLSIPRDGATAAILHRFVIVNVIVLASNLLPFVGLDGALLFSDVIHEPDLPFRANRPTRDRSQRDRLLSTYSALNAAVATGLLAMAAFFWWQLFAGLVGDLWSAGPFGVLAIVAGGIALARQAWMSVSAALEPVAAHVRRLPSKVAFRAQRPWRVRAINALRIVPEIAALDESALGILAGHLERFVVSHEACPVEGSLFVVRRARRHANRVNGEAPPPDGASARWRGATDYTRLRGNELIALAPDWQRYLA